MSIFFVFFDIINEYVDFFRFFRHKTKKNLNIFLILCLSLIQQNHITTCLLYLLR